MAQRFMMQALGQIRPLSFDGGRATPPLLCSAATPWAGVPFELHRTQPVEAERDSGPPAGEHSMLVVVEGSMEVVLREEGRDVRYHCAPGSYSLHSPERRPLLRRATGGAALMVLRITEAFRERLLYGGASTQLGYHPPVNADPTVRAICQAMKAEVERGAGTGPLFAESLSMALLSYAVERLPSQRASMRVKGTLSAAQQQRLRRYIEERLHENLAVSELAALCGLQARHFSTVFRRAFGKTPYRYVIERRLAHGAEQLSKSAADIGELALRLGFCSSSHFAVEFRRFYGVTPRGYARGEREPMRVM